MSSKAAPADILWRLGGTRSSFAMGPGSETAWQHDARLYPNGTVTMFDDGSQPRVHYQSRGVLVALDTAHHSARLRRGLPAPRGRPARRQPGQHAGAGR